MTYEVTVGDRTHEVSVRADRAGGWQVAIDGGAEVHYQGDQIGAAEWIFCEEGRARAVGVHIQGDNAILQVDGHSVVARVVDPRQAALDLGDGAEEGSITTSMPGVVSRIAVAVGDSVAKGDLVLVVEAMKMENEFKAPCDGRLTTIHVAPGQAVGAHTVLANIEPNR